MARKQEHSDDMLPIVRLVTERVARSGMSIRGYAESRGIPYSTLRLYSQKALPPLAQPPRRETLDTLALALDLPVSEVERAADASVARVYRQTSVDQNLSVLTTSTVALGSLSEEEQRRHVAETIAWAKARGLLPDSSQ